MPRIGLIFLLILALCSCKKEEEIPVVSFRLQVNGFDFTRAYANSAEVFSEFTHHISGGELICKGGEKNYSLSFENDSLESTVFELPVGDYQIKLQLDRASLYGQDWASFEVSTQEISISKETDIVDLQVKPDCALFLVKDEFNQLDQGVYMIERHAYANGYFTSYPLGKDVVTGLYYTYFTPDTVIDNPSAFLWFYQGEPGSEEGGLSTVNLEAGSRYDIEILQ
jgi:hypothetical protein